MMHAQVWRVLDTIVVEIRCNHAEGQEATSHLVYREAFHDESLAGHVVCEALANASWVAADLAYKGQVEVYDECGWV